MSTLNLLKSNFSGFTLPPVVVTVIKNKLILSITSVGALLAVRYYIIKWYRKYKNYPPGPIGLPIIGSLLLMTQLQKLTCELPLKYGPIIYTTIGDKNFVLINDSKLYKKIAKNREFINRPINLANANHSTVGFAFINNKPDYWSERRIDIQKSLINTVSKTDYMENNILKVLNGSIYNVLNDCVKNNKLFYGQYIFRKIAFNNLLFTAFGYILDYNDPLFNKYIKLSDKWVPRFIIGFLPFYLSFLKHLLKPYHNETLRLESELKVIVKQMIEKMNKSSTKDCYVSNMLDENNKTYNKLSYDTKLADILVMFSAATDTTSSVLTTAFILLSMNLDIQNEVIEELLHVFKNNKNFTLKKLKECPKFEALTYECIRLSNGGYMGVPHAIIKETTINVNNKQYTIPKNCVIVENLTFIHDMNPNENWIPEKREKRSNFNHTLNLYNFLEKDNKTNKLKFKNNESFIYFGFGKRDCIGRQLAIKQIQFIMGQLLLKYKFQLPKNKQNIKQLKFKAGFTNRVERIGLIVESTQRI